MNGREKTPQAKAARNHLVAAGAVVVALAMVGAAYAAVPLYFLFCRATGFAGSPWPLKRCHVAPPSIDR